MKLKGEGRRPGARTTAAALLACLAQASAGDIDLVARGDGRTLETTSIQQAIDDCHQSGGGTVRFPAGRFLSGTLTLRSNVTLHLPAGAVLLGSGNPEHYAMKHLVYARSAENIAITGEGAIDGQSDEFFEPARSGAPGVSASVLAAGKTPKAWRPSPLIELVECRAVRIENITIRRAPGWTVRPKNCDGVKIRGISILNDLRAINSDGIDVDSSRNVVISDCNIVAGDDCIVLKTTDDGAEPRPTENVVVTNCVLESSASALKLGTESLGDFRHCLFSNCVIRNSRTGIALMAKDGGTMEAIHFSNISITTRPKWGQGHEWPIHVDSEKRSDDSKLSVIRDVSLSDITIHTRGRIIVQGQPGAPIDGLAMRNVTLRVTAHEDISNARKISGGRRYTEKFLDLGARPAALIFGYVNALSLDGVRIHWPDAAPGTARHAVYGLELQDADLRGLRGGGSSATVPAIFLEGSRNVRQ